MRLAAALPLLLPLSCLAGAHDYYECVAANGAISYSVERCAKGEQQRRVEDNTAPASRSLGAAIGGTVKLEGSRGGHFYTTAIINGVPVRAVIDTGASIVSISPAAATRIGVDTRRGVQAKSYTANGTASVTVVTLNSVELGGNVVRNIQGSVLSQELGPDTEVLLGMAFLKHFEVNTDGVVMTLRPK